jgi:hypothetical protein
VHRQTWTIIAAALLCSVSIVSAQTYDTPDETESKVYDLSVWALTNNADATRPVNDTQEYMNRVRAIIEKRMPRQISFEDFLSISTENVDATRKGEWLADVFLKLGPGGKQTSRSVIGGDAEISVYEWKNADGSKIVAMFANRRLIKKEQTGLK